MDLSTTYLGLRLRSPLVASSGPLTGRLDGLQALEAAGIAAVVLPSLFEEQIVHEELQTSELFGFADGGNPEATSYFPDLDRFETVADRYLRHLEEAKTKLEVPVIASLNGVSPGGWTRYGRRLQDAGADGLELNLYRVVADPDVTAAEVEADHVELVGMLRDSLRIPLAVKLGPHYSAFANLAQQLVAAGADGLVLFNRFYQPDIDTSTRRITPAIELSTSSELRLPLRWTAILRGQTTASLAITTGVHTADDVARGLLAGADVTMMTSALLRNGPEHVTRVEAELRAWAEGFGATGIDELRGSASYRHVKDPEAFERANYIEGLVNYTSSFAGSAGASDR